MNRLSTRRLVRSSNHKVLAGVCGGIAAKLGISPALARILWVLFSLLPGPLWVLYVILWIVLPQENT